MAATRPCRSQGPRNADPQSTIESKILTIRGCRVILDRDLVEIYGVKTHRLNSPAAVETSIFVVRAFVRLREILSVHRNLEDRVSRLEGRSNEHREAIETVIQLLDQLRNEDQRSTVPRIGYNPPTDGNGEI